MSAREKAAERLAMAAGSVLRGDSAETLDTRIRACAPLLTPEGGDEHGFAKAKWERDCEAARKTLDALGLVAIDPALVADLLRADDECDRAHDAVETAKPDKSVGPERFERLVIADNAAADAWMEVAERLADAALAQLRGGR